MSGSALSLAAGVGRNTVSMMEAGSRLPRLPMVEHLAYVLKLSPAYLAFGVEDAWKPIEGLRSAGFLNRVKEARTGRGLTLREVGRRTGSSEGAIRAIEAGTMPTLDTVEQLAKALAVSPAWLAYGIGPMEMPRQSVRQLAHSQNKVQLRERATVTGPGPEPPPSDVS
jgi:transcriptional regulator with XRE-family HTH domain